MTAPIPNPTSIEELEQTFKNTYQNWEFQARIDPTLTRQNLIDSLVADANKLILSIIDKAVLGGKVEEIKKLKEDFMPIDTNCAEFYRENDDSCEPKEHARRSGRWEVDMELGDFITERVAELERARTSRPIQPT